MSGKNLQRLTILAPVMAVALITACGNGSEPEPKSTTSASAPARNNDATVLAGPVVLTAPGSCQAATVTWAIAGATCSGASAAALTGATAIATDLSAPNFGSASFLCTNGALAASPSAASATCLKANIQDAKLHGYLGLNRADAPQDYDGGFSMYTAAWPLYGNYPGDKAQSGLPGTWMYAKGQAPAEAYQTIEGGLGWWRDTAFATETPKFGIGAVAIDFSGVANGPGLGWGDDWTPPGRGKYGVAQLSPNLLWPPDGVNMKQGTNGELLGAGYLPLPFTNTKTTTAGRSDKPTGNNSWTLFLNAANFKGPAAFVMPYFFSHVTTTGRINNKNGSPIDTWQHFDANPSNPNKAHQMETQYIPAYMSKDAKGETYARVAPVQFPRDDKGHSVTNHRLMVYKKSALWDSVKDWFDKGGPATSSEIKLSESFEQAWERDGWSTWKIHTDAEDKAGIAPPIEWDSFAKTVVFNTSTVGYVWTQNLVTKTEIGNGSVTTLPQYYHLKKNAKGNTTWAVVQAKDVPVETGLASVEFKRVRNKPKVFETPMDNSKLIRGENTWKIPGPASNTPYKAKLGDGSTVTYYWYKFMNQPTLVSSDLTLSEREEMQRRVEKLHKEWTITKEYLPPPTVGKLVEIDPALILVPPKGFEIGYVPIATRQEQTQ